MAISFDNEWGECDERVLAVEERVLVGECGAVALTSWVGALGLGLVMRVGVDVGDTGCVLLLLECLRDLVEGEAEVEVRFEDEGDFEEGAGD